MTTESDNRDRLRSARLRITRPRIAVMDAVAAHAHADTDTIYGEVRRVLPAVSRQAIYDVLEALSSAHLLRRIQPAGHVVRYESRVGDNHHHFVCRNCGAIADTDCVTGGSPCLATTDDHGFVTDEAEVIFWGLCAVCAGTPSAADPDPLTPVPDTTTAPSSKGML